ncbi:HMG domain-containing protein 3 [Merluccius polli]|uniref:HMG domain-containing protein 3 n=1 Tax=Merluccius polli TaxID=89951 RepID=A0AA47NCM4_MERPO|nr:HMG domain-containing protein 3 [Merluccius polli]
MPVSSIEQPSPDYDGKVNVEEFWESVSLEMVSRGLVPSNRQNPFVVQPSFHNWAPWIGPQTRGSDVVLNTEYNKIHQSRHPNEAAEFLITEERLTDEILKLKAVVPKLCAAAHWCAMEAVRSLCKECGIDSKGSRMDLVMRLRKEMQDRSTYDKVFSKVWGASGGWAVFTCPCAIVYGVKFNLRAESPRDFSDLLLSMKHFPNVTLYYFARGLATHTNIREPESLPFSPHEGRLMDATEENIRLASAGHVKVSLPWLASKKPVPDEGGHPLTGSSEHYALYDRFHEANIKDKKDVLRKIELVPELCGWVNSQCAEQLFSGMRKNNHFLNMMTSSSHTVYF